MHRNRHAKIVATLGPATSSPDMIRQLFLAGVDVFRFNFSHGSPDVHAQNHAAVRDLEEETGRPIGVLVDLQGPKLRVGRFASSTVELTPGAGFRLDLDPSPGGQERVCLPHPEIFAALEPDANLLLDDGRLQLRVTEYGADYALTTVEVGGKISDNKGVNVPGVVLPLSPLTPKDRRDLEFGLQLGVDWVALSFVQRPADMTELRTLVGGRAHILAKLEKPAAIAQLERIVGASDGIMVARGDLGVELPPEKVPAIQKRILRACRQGGKPVIVATQMLDSMIQARVPTRAEAADVATAVYDGADAVMLSGETAVGAYPVDTVAMMNRIIEQVEQDPQYRVVLDAAHPGAEATTADALCCAMRRVAELLPVSATITFTVSGFSTLRAARERPKAPILSLSPNVATGRYLTLVWGVHSVYAEDVNTVDEMVSQACRVAVQEKFAKKDRPVIIMGGMPLRRSGTTNLLRVAWPTQELSATQPARLEQP